MDPISFMFLTGVLIGVAGNRADAALRWLYNRLQVEDPPIRTLTVAVRRAYLQATLLLFSAYLKELGEPIGLIQKKAQRLQGLFSKAEPDNLRWAKKTKELLDDELRRLTATTVYSFPSQNLDTTFQTLLPVIETPQDKHQEFLLTELKRQLLRELESLGSGSPETPLGLLDRSEIPPRFVEMLMNGWYEAGSYGTAVYMEWFQFFCTFFTHILNTNEPLRSVLINEVMPPNIETVTFSAFQQQLISFGEELGSKVGTAFRELHEHIEEFHSDQREQLLDVQTRLDQLLPYIALLPEIWNELNISRVAQFIEKELSSPEYTKYLGSEIANRETKLISQLPAIFIGRDNDQSQLTHFITDNGSGLLLLTAEAGFGKTSLLLNWISELQEENCFVAYHFFSTKYDVTRSIASALTHLLQQLYTHWQLDDQQLPADEQALKDTIVGLLREKLEQSDERVVIVLDGIDEAERSFDPPVPLPLPKGLFVIGSARASDTESPVYLMYWGEQTARMRLSPLSKRDVVRWMQRAGGGELIEFAEDQYSAQKIYERTGGFPLFLHYLIPQLVETIRSNGDIQPVLDDTPTDFGQYVATQFNILKHSPELRKAADVQQLFSILTVAKGPIDEDDLLQLTDLSVWEIRSLPWQVSRWTSVQQRDGVTSYTFAHKLLAEAFSAVLQSQAVQARVALTKYCSHWAEHKSLYALKHYAEHLWELGQYDELLALARDVRFPQLQKASLPYLQNLQLTTTQLGLRSATQLNDMRSAASLMFRHLKLAEDTSPQQTPLQFFDSADLSAAWLNAENYDRTAPTLWRLLMIRKLAKQGRVTEAERRLRSLINQTVISMSQQWEGELCNTLLADMEEISDDLMVEAVGKLLTPYYIRMLIITLAHRDHKSLSLAHQLRDRIFGDNRNKAVVELAKGFAKAGDWDTALQSIDSIVDSFTRAWGLSDLVKIALTQKDVGQAELLLEQLKALNEQKTYRDFDKVKRRRVDTTWQTARAWAAIGAHFYPHQEIKSSEYLSAAEKLIEQIQQASIRGRALADFALVYWSLQQPETANSFLEKAKKLSQQLRFPRERARLLTYIGRCYAEMDQQDLSLAYVDEAVDLVGKIVEPEPRAEVLKECAVDYLYAGETTKAVNVALRISLGERVSEALQQIAKLLSERGELDIAFEFAERFKRHKLTQTGILVEIGSSLIKLGREDEAEKVLSEVLHGMRLSVRRGARHHANHCLACLAKAHFVSNNSARGNALLATLLERLGKTRGISHFWAVINTVDVLGDELEKNTLEGLFQSAYGMTRQSENPAKRVWLLSLLAQSMFEMGLSQRSEELFSEAEQIIDGITGVSEKINALCQLSEALTSTDQRDRAGKLLESARKLAYDISLFRSRARELSRLSLACAKMDRLEDALLLARIPGVSSAKEARRAMSIVNAHHGKVLDALNELQGIINPRERAQAIRDITLIEIGQNNLALALELAERLHASTEGRSELFRILRTAREEKHRETFFDLLPLCIHTYGSVYEAIGQLALHDPAQASQLEEVFQEQMELHDPAVAVIDSP